MLNGRRGGTIFKGALEHSALPAGLHLVLLRTPVLLCFCLPLHLPFVSLSSFASVLPASVLLCFCPSLLLSFLSLSVLITLMCPTCVYLSLLVYFEQLVLPSSGKLSLQPRCSCFVLFGLNLVY